MSDIKYTTLVASSPSRPDRACLFDVASEQGGYFTADQGRACGFSRALLSHHAQSGRFAHVQHGLYRLREYPSSPREHVLAAWLAVGRNNAVVSHESALDLLGLSDLVPDAVHITVPRSRRNVRDLPGVKIHTTTRPLRPEDLAIRDGISITSATRSILDAAVAGAAPDQIERAVAQSVEQGLATPQRLEDDAANHSRRVRVLIAEALRKAAQ